MTETRPPGDPLRSFFGGVLLAAGVLMMVFCGGCGAVFLVLFVIDGLDHPSDMGIAIMPLFLGGIPALIGFGIFAFGRSLRRPPPWAVSARPRPPPSDPPPG